MKRWRIAFFTCFITAAIIYSWLALPLWRDVRFQTGFDEDRVILPSGYEFKPGTWYSWPQGEPSLSGPDEDAILMQEGSPEPVRILKSSGDSYPASVTSTKLQGSSTTFFLVPEQDDN